VKLDVKTDNLRIGVTAWKVERRKMLMLVLKVGV
jgi:hypothetical protein